MFLYHAFGLGIRSALPLPELTPADTAGDVEIRLAARGDPGRRRAPKATGSDVQFARPGVGAFCVRRGREIVVSPAAGVDPSVLRLFILGPALAALLHQRGFLVLHASAVAIAGEAVVFLGGSGAGKSTMAGALHARGHPVVSDEVACLEVGVRERRRPLVIPGYPRLRLWPDASRALGAGPEMLDGVRPIPDKRGVAVARGFAPDPRPLGRVYVLDEGDTPGIERMGVQAALVELVRHSYGIRSLREVRPASHFLQCAALANAVPVSRLTNRRSLEAIVDGARLVEADLVGCRHLSIG